MTIAELDAAKAFLQVLRSKRLFELLVDAAEACVQNDLNDPQIVVWQAQGLIETGNASAARTLLAKLVPTGNDMFCELHGLLGRSWKQTFFDSEDKSSPEVLNALTTSFREYKTSYDAGSPWAGVNLLALSAFAKQNGIQLPADIDPRQLAIAILGLLETGEPDKWYHASRAEAYLAMDELEKARIEIGKYIQAEDTTAFELLSTQRQFTELWQLDNQRPQGLAIIQALQAGLAQRWQQGHVELPPDEVRRTLDAARPSDQQLEAVLGEEGPIAYESLMQGLATARAVGVIRHTARGRMGTGFLVRGGALIPALGNELVVMTNAHVISDPPGMAGSVAFAASTITFEAVDRNTAYEFEKVLWQSAVKDLDCTLLRLKKQPEGITPLEIAPDIPAMDQKPRVYVIGYPGGRDLALSLQDNVLLDHEGPPQGTPLRANICYLQYRAPTEGGSSGSPVLESSWQVIGLHHAGGKKMKKLNGQDGTWPANEGILMKSIMAAAAAEGPRP